jgi:hypothetical protein
LAKRAKKTKKSEEDEAPRGPFDYFVGVDNGPTALWTILGADGKLVAHFPVPTKTTKNYQRTVDREVTRINVHQLREMFRPYVGKNILFAVEKPMVMPQRFQATLTAVRAFEATLVAFELMQQDGVGVSYTIANSLDWQKPMIPEALARKEKGKLAEKRRKKLLAACKKKGKTREETARILEWATKKFDYARTAKTDILGEAANDVARKMFPDLVTDDADSVLLAAYARRKHLALQ